MNPFHMHHYIKAQIVKSTIMLPGLMAKMTKANRQSNGIQQTAVLLLILYLSTLCQAQELCKYNSIAQSSVSINIVKAIII